VKSVVKIKTLCPQEKEAIFSVKTVHKLFPKQFIEETLKEEPGGSSIKLKAEVEGIKLIAIGYKYNKRHTLHFIMSENTGSTASGDPYQMQNFRWQWKHACLQCSPASSNIRLFQRV
jgi:hypothetical protein